MEQVKLIDKVSVYLKAGSGGTGSSAHKIFKGHFINTGGDGGGGGSIYVEADPNIFDLSKFSNKKKIIAAPGGAGSSNNKKEKMLRTWC